jgi:hypothetical protein
LVGVKETLALYANDRSNKELFVGVVALKLHVSELALEATNEVALKAVGELLVAHLLTQALDGRRLEL